MYRQWGRGKGRGGDGWMGGKEGWEDLKTNIYQSKPLKYNEKEGHVFLKTREKL